ncbi:MAG TPA: sigma-54 dependent transcriptional regulator [Planctomycetota bacterium]|jgi:transcriptional regulator with GAF, ATPase, and Fis domain|nr:sigma-54 dependent transcriptional regulator [Planctomycetota bacterium]
MSEFAERVERLLREAEAQGRVEEALAAVRAFLERRGESELPAPHVPRGKGAPLPLSPPAILDVPPERGRYGIVGRSPRMDAVFELMEKILPSSYSVLILGESGTGKELVARALHEFGPRKGKPYVSENCAAIPETLLESELFGHKRGSFTGAVADRKGHFVAANRGTIFLDEIGDMSPTMQTKLLRVLQDGEVRPVGGQETFHVDVRVIAATNQPLRERVQGRLFREDLYFRLAVLEIRLPALRERKEDIPLLAEHFLARAAAEARREVQLSSEALARLLGHSWPGNVRELENEIRRAVALCDGTIRAEDLNPEVRPG